MAASLQAIRYSRGKLEVLDQLRLPHEFHYDSVSTRLEAYDSIASMRVRGAPAIAIVAALGLAVELHNASLPSSLPGTTVADLILHIDAALDYLKQSRPTAVDLSNAILQLKSHIRNPALETREAVRLAFIEEAERIFEKDLRNNIAIGDHGARWLQDHAAASAETPVTVLTHCNTGSLATSGHGTALGIVRSLHGRGWLRRAYCTETRPYNQGSRLTAFELTYERIPGVLITDSMAAALFRTQKAELNIAAVVVGADRVVRNGDTANKIGTYQLAVLARHHGIKFIVAAPTTSIDLETKHGDDITIEERRAQELTQCSGPVVGASGAVGGGEGEGGIASVRIATADQGIEVWNPAFDVTPAELIDVIVTERGVVEKGPDGTFDFSKVLPDRPCGQAMKTGHEDKP